MTVSTINAVSGPYTANGVTTVFPFTFKCLSSDEVRVTIVSGGIETEQSPTLYSVALATEGGSVTFATAPATGDVYIYSDPHYTQETGFSSGQAYSPTVVNEALDRAAVRDQHLRRLILSVLDNLDAGQIGDIRSDLASPASDKGPGLIGFSHAATYLAATVGLKAQQTIALSDAPFGATGDGTTDDTSAVQDAFDFAMEHGKPIRDSGNMFYRLTDQIVIPTPVDFEGVMPVIPFGVTENTPSGGTRFLLDHTGIGFYHRDDANAGIPALFSRMAKFATYRPHSSPTGGWSPTVCDEDIRNEFRLFLDNYFPINPYIGIKVRQNGSLWAHRIFGQPLYTGIEFERSSDIQNLDDLHFWPVWSQSSDVYDYTIPNAVAMRVRRADGLRIGRVFSYAYAWTLDHQDVNGDVSGMADFAIDQIYADKCGGAVRIKGDYYQARGSIGSINVNSDSAVGGSGGGVEVIGATASYIDIQAMTVTRAHSEALKVTGAAHRVNATPYRIADWNRLADGSSAFHADDGATINLLATPSFNATSLLYDQGTSGVINSGPSQKRTIAIVDDGVAVLPLPSINKMAIITICPLTVPASGIPSGMWWVRSTASPSIAAIPAGTTITNVDTGTGALTGTTGTDGHSRINTHTDGNVYIENRSGAAYTLTIEFMGS